MIPFGVSHIAINSLNFERTINFYVDNMGFEKAFTMDRDGEVVIQYLYMGNGQFLEIFNNRPDGHIDSHFSHLCIRVADIDSVAKELDEKGVLTVPIREGFDGSRQCWATDPDGNRIEIQEIARGSKQSNFLKTKGLL